MNNINILEKVLRDCHYEALKVCDKHLPSKSKDNGHS